MTTKRPRRNPGDVLRIDLGDGTHSYARTLTGACFAFYDCRSDHEVPLDQILRSPILFCVTAHHTAVETGRWPIVGTAPLEPTLSRPPPRFIQDELRPDQFSIYEDGKIRPATKAECVGLEYAAVWAPEHVEERLQDHYAGRKNRSVELLGIKDPQTLLTMRSSTEDRGGDAAGIESGSGRGAGRRQNRTECGMSDGTRSLMAAKDRYPFERWQSGGLPQYTAEACASVQAVFDQLIQKLIQLGNAGPETAKVQFFRESVEALNELNAQDDGFIETEEREELCELYNVIAVAAGIDPEKFGGGEGLASEWRDW